MGIESGVRVKYFFVARDVINQHVITEVNQHKQILNSPNILSYEKYFYPELPIQFARSHDGAI